eukprot:704111-Rhodomonas_salina.1
MPFILRKCVEDKIIAVEFDDALDAVSAPACPHAALHARSLTAQRATPQRGALLKIPTAVPTEDGGAWRTVAKIAIAADRSQRHARA